MSRDFARWFADIRAGDLPVVGGKNASLGEMYSALASQGVRVPNGFALTAEVYRSALAAAGAWSRLAAVLKGRRYWPLGHRCSGSKIHRIRGHWYGRREGADR